ncbi:MAG: hypothetical protein QM791_22470 [Ferruginibacter sp.]
MKTIKLLLPGRNSISKLKILILVLVSFKTVNAQKTLVTDYDQRSTKFYLKNNFLKFYDLSCQLNSEFSILLLQNVNLEHVKSLLLFIDSSKNLNIFVFSKDSVLLNKKLTQYQLDNIQDFDIADYSNSELIVEEENTHSKTYSVFIKLKNKEKTLELKTENSFFFMHKPSENKYEYLLLKTLELLKKYTDVEIFEHFEG